MMIILKAKNVSEVLNLFDDEELRFLEKESRKSGVLFESVQHIIDADLRSLAIMCFDIMIEEGNLCAGSYLDEHGNIIEKESDPNYNAERWGLAEEIYIFIDKTLREEES